MNKNIKVLLGMFAIWFCAWGMWSFKVPYFEDDLSYAHKFQQVSFPEAAKMGWEGGDLISVSGFARTMMVPYGWIGYRLGAPLHHFIMAFFHFISAYLFWILLTRLRIPYLISIFIASVFMLLPITYEAFHFTATMLQPSLSIFIATCLLFAKYMKEKRLVTGLTYVLIINILLFFLCLTHPSLLAASLMLLIFALIIFFKESSKWILVITGTAKKCFPIMIGPAVYLGLYFIFPHNINPNLSIYQFLRNFLSVQYHCCKALLSMFSADWMSASMRALTSNLWVFGVFIFCSVILYITCFRKISDTDGDDYSIRRKIIDILWGYLWMIGGFFIYLFDVGFASNSRSYYIASLGIALIGGSIVHLFYRGKSNEKHVSLMCYSLIVLLAFFACGAAYEYDGQPKFWKKAINIKYLDDVK